MVNKAVNLVNDCKDITTNSREFTDKFSKIILIHITLAKTRVLLQILAELKESFFGNVLAKN